MSSIPINIRRILSSGLKAVSPQNWNKISKFVPFLRKYKNFGDKIYKSANSLEAKNLYELYYNLCSHWKNPSQVVINGEEPKNLFTKFNSAYKHLDSQQQMMILDFMNYLPNDILVKVDRAAMASSLETRIPFLDHKLIEYVWKIPHSLKYRNGQGKWILRHNVNLDGYDDK